MKRLILLFLFSIGILSAQTCTTGFMRIADTLKSADNSGWNGQLTYTLNYATTAAGSTVVGTTRSITVTNGAISLCLAPGNYSENRVQSGIQFRLSAFWNVPVSGGSYCVYCDNGGPSSIETQTAVTPTLTLNLNQLAPGGGTDGQCLVFNSSTQHWSPGTCASGVGTVTSINVAVPLGFSSSGGPVTTSGTITLGFSSNLNFASDTLFNSIAANHLTPGEGLLFPLNATSGAKFYIGQRSGGAGGGSPVLTFLGSPTANTANTNIIIQPGSGSSQSSIILWNSHDETITNAGEVDIRNNLIEAAMRLHKAGTGVLPPVMWFGSDTSDVSPTALLGMEWRFINVAKMKLSNVGVLNLPALTVSQPLITDASSNITAAAVGANQIPVGPALTSSSSLTFDGTLLGFVGANFRATTVAGWGIQSQTATATNWSVFPGVSGGFAGVYVSNSNDVANFGRARLGLTGTTATLVSSAVGTGTAPILLNVDFPTTNLQSGAVTKATADSNGFGVQATSASQGVFTDTNNRIISSVDLTNPSAGVLALTGLKLLKISGLTFTWALQNATVDSSSGLAVIPSGVGTQGGLEVWNSSSATDYSRLRLVVNGANATFNVQTQGSGIAVTNMVTTIPSWFFNPSGTNRFTVDTNGAGFASTSAQQTVYMDANNRVAGGTGSQFQPWIQGAVSPSFGTPSGTLTATIGLIVDGDCTQVGSITLTGAAIGDLVFAGASTALPSGVNAIAKVTATNTVTVEVCNLSETSYTVPSTIYKVGLLR